jgi:hypothetical protein
METEYIFHLVRIMDIQGNLKMHSEQDKNKPEPGSIALKIDL